MQTTNIVDENIKRIGELFPNCLTERLNDEGKPEMAIDFDQPRQELSKDIVVGPEETFVDYSCSVFNFHWSKRAILSENYKIQRNNRENKVFFNQICVLLQKMQLT